MMLLSAYHTSTAQNVRLVIPQIAKNFVNSQPFLPCSNLARLVLYRDRTRHDETNQLFRRSHEHKGHGQHWLPDLNVKGFYLCFEGKKC
ncbi:hypothetical protein E2C01_066721 [Portunus trituberculatus]|uniref:Uncharacterized protein n=1 Tax=Portunus trituberculatus TaxID=210409 RepID=A0A5B7HRE9_PORTR|nr:hypothetical protein [Portunus trituberculatus]